MDDNDVVLSPPISQTPKAAKGKEVIGPDGIHIGSSDTAMFVDEKVDGSFKGKAINYTSNVLPDQKAKFQGGVANDFVGSPGERLASASDNINYPDLFLSHAIDINEYARLLHYFDNADIPPGVEAPLPPILGLFDPVKSHINLISGNSSDTNCQAAMSLASASHGPISETYNSNNPLSGLYLEESIDIDEYAVMVAHFDEMDYHPGTEAPVPNFLSLSEHPKSNTKAVPGSSSSMKAQTNGFSPASSSWKLPQASSSKMKQTSLQHQGSAPNNPVGVALSKYGEQTQSNNVTAKQVSSLETDESTRTFKNFKQFHTVEDHSDHHYTHRSSTTMQKNWAKRIQEEWKILEKDLPDAIYVRAYETRMDLLRAVIVGAEGTPYHDGLFFFDVYFPSDYPNVPPHVYYHSGGLRPNPNLYACGKVCLSLLNTWPGGFKEQWIPGESTMLQVLVSIQGLILNTEPYFNEPGWEVMKGTPSGEMESKKYNENTLILSLKTMVHMMKRPPKYFEEFVFGHFRDHAQDILVACKAYMVGAEVGCLVKGSMQGVTGNKSCSQEFKNSVAQFLPIVVKELARIGAKGCEKFLITSK